jgi:hypothetical protein
MRKLFTAASAFFGVSVWGGQVVAQAPLPDMDAPALIRSDYGNAGNFEVVVRQGNQFCHYYRNNDASRPPFVGPTFWQFTGCHGQEFGQDVASAPAFIQSEYGNQGNFEVVVQNSAHELCHYYRDNDAAGQPWKFTGCFTKGLLPEGIDVTSAPALIQSRFGKQVKNFEIMALVTGPTINNPFIDFPTNILCHFYRDNDNGAKWKGPTFCLSPTQFHPAFQANDYTSAPALIQSSFGDHGDFEVVVTETGVGRSPSGSGGRVVHYFRNNDIDNFPWGPCTGNVTPPCPTGEPIEDVIIDEENLEVSPIPNSAASLIQNTFSSGSSLRGNLEVMVRQGFELLTLPPRELCHYTESDNTGQWGSGQPQCFGTHFLSAPSMIETGTGLFGHFQVVVWATSADGKTPQLISMGEDGTEVIPTIDVPPDQSVAQAQ